MLLSLPAPTPGAPVDVAPYAVPLPDGVGLMWEDPREIHRVVVRFKGAAPSAGAVRLEYWGSRWPEQRLPKDREPGGGDVGWWELGNWYNGGWRRADTRAAADGSAITFTFNPVNAREFRRLPGYAATFRYTLKVRLASDGPMPAVAGIEAYTDSTWQGRSVHLAFRDAGGGPPRLAAFNGHIEGIDDLGRGRYRARLLVAANADPNTFDRTLVTVRRGKAFTFRVDDLAQGPLYVPAFGAALLADDDTRDFAAVEREVQAKGGQTLRSRVAGLPEQTWRKAWEGMPAKRSRIYFPLGLDGGRQRFRLWADGSVDFRTNNHFLTARPGKDTPRLQQDGGNLHIAFGLPGEPSRRDIPEDTPICVSTWQEEGGETRQVAFATALEGTRPDGPVPPADTAAVFVTQLAFSNSAPAAKTFRLRLSCRGGDGEEALRVDDRGFVWAGDRLRAHLTDAAHVRQDGSGLAYEVEVPRGKTAPLVVKVPYVLLTEPAEREALARLSFGGEFERVAAYWRRRLDESARLVTPEPDLDGFYRAHAGHLLINCEREPGSDRRFARVGSFAYGAYGNESCMMVIDLDRRGYHKEAQDCLDAWLRYEGTVGLPGDFGDHDGVLYGAGGYEAGGYNQHHGWILWCMAEHYRFTRDAEWLKRAAPGILKAADWIVRQRARTADRKDLARGLLPAGSLEDIGDWWPWLSTNCYTWRGLDSAAWALEQAHHPDAGRIRKEADAYHRALLAAFRKAAERSPVVRLRDGTAVPKFPSTPYRRGRYFGWICETLEGAIHLLITGALKPDSPEAAWILDDYEDNLFLSNQYGYTLPDFERWWFGRGGMSMQACLLLDVEPYLARDEVKSALRAAFNAIAVGFFPDVRMLTEHALPEMGDWRGDHYKSSDEANAAGWLRYLFVREQGDDLLVGQAVPRDWLGPGRRCGIERGATWFGPMSVVYEGAQDTITATLDAPRRNPPAHIRLRFRGPDGQALRSVTVNGRPWAKRTGEWVLLPGDIGRAVVVASYGR